MVVTFTRRSQGKYPAVFVSICDGLDKHTSDAIAEKKPSFDHGRKPSEASLPSLIAINACRLIMVAQFS